MHQHLSTLEHVRDTLRKHGLDNTTAWTELVNLIYAIKCEILDMAHADEQRKLTELKEKMQKSSSRRSV